MGDVVSLSERRAMRCTSAMAPARTREPATFFLDLASPYTYLAAERVDRLFADVRWTPVIAPALSDPTGGRSTVPWTPAVIQAAERRAAVLHMPLVWPDREPGTVRAAMRVAAYATAEGRGSAFVLAAGRLAFCGGFDVDDPEILAEAAAAARLPLDGCLHAARDARLDAPMKAAGRLLAAAGADRLPAVRVGGTLFCGEHRLAEAAGAARLCTASPQAHTS